MVPTMHKLKTYRQANGIRMRMIAESIGVSKPTISLWESGKRTPRLEHIRAIEKYTNGAVTADDWEPQREVVL